MDKEEDERDVDEANAADVVVEEEGKANKSPDVGGEDFRFLERNASVTFSLEGIFDIGLSGSCGIACEDEVSVEVGGSTDTVALASSTLATWRR